MPPDASRRTPGGLSEDARAMSSLDILSRRMRSAPAANASRNSFRLPTSTSTRQRCPALAFARVTASVSEPTAAMWLSLMRIPSESPIRWLNAPPVLTAYFSRRRKPGVVFRVSRILAVVPSTSSAARRAVVAMPERRWRRFNAGRSALRMVPRSPATRPMRSPALIVLPSSKKGTKALEASMSSKTLKAA